MAPVLLFLLFTVLEGSLALFTIDSARFAAGEGARQVAEGGTDPNADNLAVEVIRTGPLSFTTLADISHIDIYHLIQQSNGQLTVDSSEYNSYNLDGSTISSTWPPRSRSVRNGSSDFIGLTIFYRYNWISGSLLASGPLVLSQSFYVRLEPQTY